MQEAEVLQRFHNDLEARLWFCYRTGFPALGAAPSSHSLLSPNFLHLHKKFAVKPSL